MPAPKTIVTLNSNGPYWQAAWSVAGKRCRESLGAKASMTKREALERCRAIEAKLPHCILRDEVPTLEAFTARYLANRTGIAEGTRSLHEQTIRYLIGGFGAAVRIDSIDRAGAADWRAKLARGELAHLNRRKQNQKAPAEPTVCVHVRNAKAIFETALVEDLLPFNPFDRLRATAPTPPKTWATVTDEQVEALITAGETMQPWPLLLGLCYYAGMRRNEALSLRWVDVDFEKNRIHVRPATIDTKHKPRETMMEPRLRELLTAAYLGAEGGDHCIPPAAFDLNGYHRQAAILWARAGLELWKKPLHTLRKARATAWRSKYPEHVVDAWLGHGPEVARAHYVRVDERYYAQPQQSPEATPA